MAVDPWGDDDHDKWITLWFQAVPGHIGHPSEDETDYYADFLPPPVEGDYDGKDRAVVIVTDDTEKIGQRYVDPVLVLTGEEWMTTPFPILWQRIEDALSDWQERQHGRRISD